MSDLRDKAFDAGRKWSRDRHDSGVANANQTRYGFAKFWNSLRPGEHKGAGLTKAKLLKDFKEGLGASRRNPSPITAKRTKDGVTVSVRVPSLDAAKKLAKKLGAKMTGRMSNPRAAHGESKIDTAYWRLYKRVEERQADEQERGVYPTLGMLKLSAKLDELEAERKRQSNPRLSSNLKTWVQIKRVPIDRQGYDKNGRYWGVGQTLWSWTVENDTDSEDGFERADSKREVLTDLKSMAKLSHFFKK